MPDAFSISVSGLVCPDVGMREGKVRFEACSFETDLVLAVKSALELAVGALKRVCSTVFRTPRFRMRLVPSCAIAELQSPQKASTPAHTWYSNFFMMVISAM
jgi:hypothetical protein